VGTVQAVDDVFEETAVQSLLEAVFSVVEYEKKVGKFSSVSDGKVNWHVGISGGTQLMGAVAGYAANLIGGTPYYVSRIKEGDEFQPGGKVFSFPNLGALGYLGQFREGDVHTLLETDDYSIAGAIEGKHGTPSIKLVSRLNDLGLLVIDDENKEWRLTQVGRATVAVASRGPNYATERHMIEEDDEEEHEEEEEDQVEGIGELITVFKEISHQNCYCPVLGQALRIHNIIVSAELRSDEGEEFLQVRAYDLTSGEEEPISWNHPLTHIIGCIGRFLPADMSGLVYKIFASRWYQSGYRQEWGLERVDEVISKEQLASIISNESPRHLMGVIACLWMWDDLLISKAEVKIPDFGNEFGIEP